ncbi:hypothetical protein BGZ68_006250 [Mortierella alpina]|nr:hypothetical protein BGZ68_006250 [Mortierella alpina]
MYQALSDEKKQYPALGGLVDTTSVPPFSGAVHVHPQYLSQGDASVFQNPLNLSQDGVIVNVNGAALFSKEMVIDSDCFLYFGLEQGLFCGGPIPPAQVLPNDACVQPQQHLFQPSAAMPMFQFDNSHLLRPPEALPAPDFSALSQEAAELQQQLQYPSIQLKPSFQLPSEPVQFYKKIFAETMTLDFSKGRNPFLERLSSPDGSVSTASEQGYFDIVSEDDYTYFPDPSYSPAVAAFGAESDFLIKPFDQLALPFVPEGPPSSPGAMPATGLGGSPHSLHGSFSPSSITSATASHTFSTPALASTLKQQSTGYISDESDDSEDESKPKRKKRVRKVINVKAPAKPKGLKPVLRCEFPGCKITCSSIPSLSRHFETHKWRGKYSPVRCEACQNPLSNEFSVQRHIMRSPDNALCRRMRVYSIMRSAIDIDTTVRFYPKRGHGKKTKIVDLGMIREKYL